MTVKTLRFLEKQQRNGKTGLIFEVAGAMELLVMEIQTAVFYASLLSDFGDPINSRGRKLLIAHMEALNIEQLENAELEKLAGAIEKTLSLFEQRSTFTYEEYLDKILVNLSHIKELSPDIAAALLVESLWIRFPEEKALKKECQIRFLF